MRLLNRRFALAIVSCAAALMLAGLAHAQPRLQPPGGGGSATPAPAPAPTGGLLTKVTPEQTAQLMLQAGYKDVKIVEGSQGARHVGGKIGEIPVFALHLNCEGGACGLVTYMVMFGRQQGIDANYMNAWHQAWRFVKLYRDPEENLIFMWDVPLLSGMTPQYLQGTSVLFATMLNKLLEFKPGQQ